MACECKHNREAIEDGYRLIAKLRVMFIKRMTEDSETQDRRRKDYNQAIFRYESDEDVDAWNAEIDRLTRKYGSCQLKRKHYGETYPCWEPMDMDMVLECFDNAVKDWRRSWCDVENCTRKP